MANDLTFIKREGGETLACRVRPGKGPTVLWLGGFRSDMDGTKAEAVDTWAKESGRAYVRFDYSGHGQSSGKFEEGTISRWRDDALCVLDEYCPGDVIALGSSMGAWIALLLAKARPETIKALTLIAPAPDFTEKLMWQGFDQDTRRRIVEQGVYYEPSDYSDEPTPITRALIEDGRQNLVMDAPIAFTGPVRILQGVQDESVPWSYALELMGCLQSEDIVFSLSKSGDHRLSTPADIIRLTTTLDLLCQSLQKPK
ncbi:MAG: alpha/beta hydrolase [Robiginitomaculum sp.]|nr:alpha/beta hydrolase [Robiginitomaculum sp.]MDQ7078776.1 alpha/beta hydrolase [Robiginitomaculum sp.]